MVRSFPSLISFPRDHYLVHMETNLLTDPPPCPSNYSIVVPSILPSYRGGGQRIRRHDNVPSRVNERN